MSVGSADGEAILLYDGLCGFCNSSVQFILKHENRHTLRFAALQGTFASAAKQRHPRLEDVDSLVWLEGEGPEERVSLRSAAALKVVSYLGGLWKVFLIFWLVPAPIRDFAYDVFARNRYRWFGQYSACPVPSSDVRARFLP